MATPKKRRAPRATKVPAIDKKATVLHLADTTTNNAGHALAHTRMAKRSSGNKTSLKHNLDHAEKHAKESLEHGQKLLGKLKKDPAYKQVIKDMQTGKKSNGE